MLCDARDANGRCEVAAQLLRTVAAQHKPTLLVWGDEDRILPASHLEQARTVFPHAEVHLFEKCGHMPQIEREDEFVSVVSKFLDA